MRFHLLNLLVPVALLAQAPATKAPAAAPAKPSAAAVAKPAAAAKPVVRPVGARPVPTAKAKPAPAAAAIPATDEEKAIYALGLSIHGSLAQFDLTPAELELVKRAMSDAAAGKPAGQLQEWGPKIQGLVQSRAARGSEREKTAGKAYADRLAAEPASVRTPTGLVFRELTAGTGANPKAEDNVKVHYRGTLINGTEFDSSYKRGEPAQFPLKGVIPCWTEGVQRIKVGGKGRLVCPSDIAYGDQGRPPTIPGGATLVFEVELLEIVGPPPAPVPPPPPPAPPQQPQAPAVKQQ